MRAIVAGIVTALALGRAAQAASSYAIVSHTPDALTAYDASTIRRHGDVVEVFQLKIWPKPVRRRGVMADYMLSHIEIDCLLRKEKTDQDVLYRLGSDAPVLRADTHDLFQNLVPLSSTQHEADLACRRFPSSVRQDHTSRAEVVTNYRASFRR